MHLQCVPITRLNELSHIENQITKIFVNGNKDSFVLIG